LVAVTVIEKIVVSLVAAVVIIVEVVGLVIRARLSVAAVLVAAPVPIAGTERSC
jgi:hypothetical protein